jgi:alpha-D-ribose 1-methylphosphonate 5-triphosphate synthase subunit PhnI
MNLEGLSDSSPTYQKTHGLIDGRILRSSENIKSRYDRSKKPKSSTGVILSMNAEKYVHPELNHSSSDSDDSSVSPVSKPTYGLPQRRVIPSS